MTLSKVVLELFFKRAEPMVLALWVNGFTTGMALNDWIVPSRRWDSVALFSPTHPAQHNAGANTTLPGHTGSSNKHKQPRHWELSCYTMLSWMVSNSKLPVSIRLASLLWPNTQENHLHNEGCQTGSYTRTLIILDNSMQLNWTLMSTGGQPANDFQWFI